MVIATASGRLHRPVRPWRDAGELLPNEFCGCYVPRALEADRPAVRIQIFRIRRAHAIDKNMSFAVKVPTALTNYLAVSGLNKLIIAIKNEVDVFIVALCM